jgi:hypothetical protein
MIVNRTIAPKAKVLRQLRRLQTVLSSAAARLAKITPPRRIEAPHELLAKGVREYAQELTGVIALVQAGHSTRALNRIPALKGIRDMTAASRAITKAGFQIGT